MTVLCPQTKFGALTLSAAERALKHKVVAGLVKPAVRQLFKMNCEDCTNITYTCSDQYP